jgi:hypothetical protein
MQQNDFSTSEEEETNFADISQAQSSDKRVCPQGSGAMAYAEWLVNQSHSAHMPAREISIMSFCSGMVTEVIAGAAIKAACDKRGQKLSLHHRAACENNPTKQALIIRRFSEVQNVFHDVNQMSGRFVKDNMKCLVYCVQS